MAAALAAAEARALVRPDEADVKRQDLLAVAAAAPPPPHCVDVDDTGPGTGVVVSICDTFGWAHLCGLSVDGVQRWLSETLTKDAEAKHTQHSPSRGERRIGAKRAAQRARGASTTGGGLQFVHWGAADSFDPRNNTTDSKKKDRTLLLARSQYPHALVCHIDKFFQSSVAERDFGASAGRHTHIHTHTYVHIRTCVLC